MLVRVSKSRSGAQYVYTVESYRDPAGRSRQRIIERHGRLDELEAGDPEALTKLRAKVASADSSQGGRRGSLTYDTSVASDQAAPLSLGWLLADAMLMRLGAVKIAQEAAKQRGWTVPVDQAIRLLVCSRVVWPCSKLAKPCGRLAAWSKVDHEHEQFLDGPSRQLGQMHQALDGIASLAGELRQAASQELRPLINLSQVDYDITNYNFQIDHPGPFSQSAEALRQLGLAGDQRWRQAAQLGLFLDADGLPLAYRLFGGEVHQATAVTRALAEFKTAFGQPRVVLVTDTNTTTHPDLSSLARQGDGWIVSESRPPVDPRRRGWPLETNGPVGRSSPNSTGHRLRPVGTYDSDGETTTVAEKTILPHLCPGFDPGLSGWADQAGGPPTLRTSETELPDQAILKHYHQLQAIEQAFRVSSSEVVPARSQRHIEAHFVICFLSLLVTRLLERWTGLPAEPLLESARHFNAVAVGDGLYRICRPPIWNTIDRAIGASLDRSWATLSEIRDWRRQLVQSARQSPLTQPSYGSPGGDGYRGVVVTETEGEGQRDRDRGIGTEG